MENSLHISVSPHIRSPRTTAGIMLDVLVALVPASVAACIIFGIRSLLVIAVCIAASVLSEYLFCVITKKENTVTDLSAAVTGLLIALNLPVNVPIWQAIVGSVFAIVCVKCFFGGIGKNFANPAITARIFMLVAFGSMAKPAFPLADTVSSATPLELLASGEEAPGIVDLLLGMRGGALGETCTIALLIGGIYLVARRVINPAAPVTLILTTFLFTLALVGGDAAVALQWTLSGGIFIGAIYMATDYSTTPTTTLGKMVFGVGSGLITVIIRFFGNYPEGVSFAILFMNILTPYIDRLTARRPFGSGGDAR